MSVKSEKNPFQRLFIIGSGLVFLGFMVVPLAEVFRNSSQPSPPTATSQIAAAYQQMQVQEQGYEQVLKREPNNPTALKDVVQLRLQMYKLKGSIALLEKTVDPLDKLIQLYPKEKSLLALRDEIKQQIAAQQPGKPSQSPSKTDVPPSSQEPK
jgi:hypothetical protein